jgi:glycosyltransferase involved in cell wall biosynthesis
VRILEVIQEMQTGGAERVVLSLAAGAEAAGDAVAIAAAPGALDESVRCPRFELPLIQRRPGAVLVAAWHLARVLRRWRPTVVHCHNPTMALVTAIATIRGSRVPAVVSVHGVPDEDYVRASRALRWSRLPVVACGPGVARALAEHGVDVLTTIVNGISPAPAPADRGSLMEEWGLPSDRPLIVSVGRLVEQKDHALVIRAIAELPDVTLAILGKGPDERALDDLRAGLGVGDRVVLAGRRRDAREIIGAADVLAMGSRWEGLPLVALEAMSARTPLVATDVRGIRELLINERHCLLVRSGDATAFAHALDRILRDSELRTRLVDEASAVASGLTIDAMVARFLDLFDEVAASSIRSDRAA